MEILVSLQKESRNPSFREGAASSSAKTGAAITRLPFPSAASSAERACVFSVSSSFHSATRTFVSIAVVIARADHALSAPHAFSPVESQGPPDLMRNRDLPLARNPRQLLHCQSPYSLL